MDWLLLRECLAEPVSKCTSCSHDMTACAGPQLLQADLGPHKDAVQLVWLLPRQNPL